MYCIVLYYIFFIITILLSKSVRSGRTAVHSKIICFRFKPLSWTFHMRDQTSIRDFCEIKGTLLGAQKRLKSRNCCCRMIGLKM